MSVNWYLRPVWLLGYICRLFVEAFLNGWNDANQTEYDPKVYTL